MNDNLYCMTVGIDSTYLNLLDRRNIYMNHCLKKWGPLNLSQ